MKKCFFILALIIGAGPAFAQEDIGVDLEKITITTNRRAPITYIESTENVEVLTEKQISMLPARNLGEVLNYISGVDIEPRQGLGQGAAVTIQGSDARHVKVMVDGIPLNTQASGQIDLSVIPLNNVARIEVIKGSASSIWGSALGGVVNVITKDTGTKLIPEGSITTSWSEFRTQKQNVNLSGGFQSLGYFFSSGYLESGGKGPRNDILQKNNFAKLTYDLDNFGKINSSFGYNDSEVNSGKLPDDRWQSQVYRAKYGLIGWKNSVLDADISVDLKHSKQDIITKLVPAVDTEEFDTWVSSKDKLTQLSVNSVFRPWARDLLVAGADFDYHSLKSTYYEGKKAVYVQAPYINYTYRPDPWDFNLGLRYDHNSEFG